MNIGGLASLLSFILILGGIASIVFPVAPSIPTIWFGIFLYAISHHFATVNQNFMVLVSIIALGTIGLDFALSKSGVKKLRAGPWGIFGAVVGGLVGSFFGAIGTYLVGPLAGALAAEMLLGHDQVYSYQSGNYTIVAFMGGTIMKLLASIGMVGLFILRLQGKL